MQSYFLRVAGNGGFFGVGAAATRCRFAIFLVQEYIFASCNPGGMTIFGFLIRPANTVQAVATRFGVSADFIRFAIVGTMGFCWDTATVYALRHLVGLYIAGFAAYLVAATANWVANRFWTFRHRRHGAMHQQWLKFLMANLVGFVLNRGVYSIAITVSAVCHREPVFATAMGSFAGLGFNYFLSKRLVFAEVNEAP